MSSKKQPTRRTIAITEDELYLISGALGTYQQQIEKSAHHAYGYMTEKQRARLIDHGLSAVTLRSRLHKMWGDR